MSKYTYYFSSIFKLLFGTENFLKIVKIFLGLSSEKSHIIKFKEKDLTFKVRGAMDIWCTKETVIDKFYEVYGTKVKNGWNVIDIGGGLGDFSIFVAKDNPDGKIAAFEPFKESFELLKENIAINKVSNITAFQEAIWTEKGKLNLNVTLGEPLKIISSQTDVTSTDSNDVNCISLKEALDRLNFETCDFMKVDCEGAEYEILMSSTDETLHRLKRIVMEYHDNVAKYNHPKLRDFLISKGFKVNVYPNFVHGDIGYLYAYREE